MFSPRLCLVLAFACGLVSCPLLVAARRQAANPICPSELPALANAILARPEYAGASWAVKMVYLPTSASVPTEIFAHRTRDFMLPASNNKVLTTAASLLALGGGGATARFNTTLSISADLRQACVFPRGDMGLTTAGLNGGVRALGEALRQRQAVQRSTMSAFLIVGELVLDASYFIGEDFPDTWEFGDLVETYGAPPSCAVVDQNSATVVVTPGATVGSAAKVKFVEGTDAYALAFTSTITTTTSSQAFGVSTSYALGDPSIHLTGSVAVGSSPFNVSYAVAQPRLRLLKAVEYLFSKELGLEVASIRLGTCDKAMPSSSPSTHPNQHIEAAAISHTIVGDTVADLMRHCLKVSDNTYAELFLKQLGHQWQTLHPSVLSKATMYAGIDAVNDSLVTKLGVAPSLFMQMDGSGVSRRTLVTANALTDVLVGMWLNTSIETRELYKSFLPIAGIDGTLADRFVNTPAQGIVFAKTGTLTGVSALSGYMIHDEFPTVVFSIMINGSDKSTPIARRGIDDLVLLLPRLKQC